MPDVHPERAKAMSDYIEEFAQAAHADYLKKMKNAENGGHPSMVDWNDLPEELKESNRNQARSIIEKMNTPGFHFNESTTLSRMAQAEHIRYVKEKLAKGYTHAYLKYGTELARKASGEKWDALSNIEQKNLAIKLMREKKKNHLLVSWNRLSKADKQKNFDAIEHMVTYVQQKRIALGLELPPDFLKKRAVTGKMLLGSGVKPNYLRPPVLSIVPFLSVPIFGVLPEIEREEQSELKEKLSFGWNTVYATDRKAARKNLDRLCEYLLAGDYDMTIQLFVQQPAADWLNYVFLDSKEVRELIDIIQKTSPECREVVSVAITKEMERLVNYNTLFELIHLMSRA